MKSFLYTKFIGKVEDAIVSAVKNQIELTQRNYIENMERLNMQIDSLEKQLSQLGQDVEAVKENVNSLKMIENDTQNCITFIQEKVEYIIEKQFDILNADEKAHTAKFEKMKNLEDQAKNTSNCISFIQEKVEYIIEKQFDILNADEKAHAAGFEKMKNLADQAKDISNCINFIQEKVQYTIGKQYELFAPLNLINSYCQNQTLNKDKGILLDDYDYYKQIHELTKVYDIDCKEFSFVRLGKEYDGGYVMVKPFSNNRIAYSIGICDDVSWDKEMAEYGYQIFQYDHTIDNLPEENPSFHWRKIGLGVSDSDEINTIQTMLKDNNHDNESGMVLKIDIEGCEWDVINSWSSDVIEKFDQIVIEFHELTVKNNREKVIAVLKKIKMTHLAIHVHGNNNGSAIFSNDIMTPDLLEVTYIKKRENVLMESLKIFPLKIDYPNKKGCNDLILGKW